MAAIPSYRAEMVGLSERDRTLLRSLLQATQARTGVHWDGGADQPAVHFIDIDGQAGAEFWQSLSEGERVDTAIVISSTPPAGAVRWVAKPLRSASLLAALTIMPLGAGAAQFAAQAATQARVEPAVPAGPLRLLDILDGPRFPTAQALQSPHWPDLVLGSGNRHAMRTADMDSYIYGFAVSLEVTHVGKYVGGPLDDELRVDLDTLRWLALLYAPLDEIAARLPDPPARVRLSGLPPFGHLPHTLQHVRMAAWLMQHAASVAELAEMIGIDEDGVRRFIGACDIFGLAHNAVEAPGEPVPIVVPAPIVVPEPVAAPEPVVEPEPVMASAVEPTVEATAAPQDETPPPAPPPAQTLSVLERLSAKREQNRARVAAAIRAASSN